jgi:hypothetical protein
MHLRNLTPHPVRIISGQTETLLPAENPTPRVADESTPAGTIQIGTDHIPLVNVRPLHITDLPAPVPNVGLIVARVVATARPDRTDLYFPFDFIRDNHNQPIACRTLARIRL